MDHHDHSAHANHNAMDHSTMDHSQHTMVADHSGHEGHDHGDGTSECKMNMLLHFGACETILFSSWVANTAAKFAVAFIAIFIMAILYEGLKYYREKWFNEKLQSEIARNGTLLKTDQTWRAILLDKHHLAQTGMHLLQVTISYILMLIIMIANVWLCLAVVLGACCGYFLFGWVRQNAIDVTEHCH